MQNFPGACLLACGGLRRRGRAVDAFVEEAWDSNLASPGGLSYGFPAMVGVR